MQTLDFFTPVVDDPYTYGQIAAANSLSDVYAMGGTPLTAMNIVCFPSCLSPKVLEDILKGGADKVIEAGALLVGGHSVEDEEPKYGLSVTGTVHPKKIWTNNNARIGDYLVLTKPLGLGILNTAIKADLVDLDQYNDAVNTMVTLNKYAFEAVEDLDVSASTDITGFGLLGHSYEMATGSNVSLEIWSGKVPIIKATKKLAEMGIIPAGMYSNKEYLGRNIIFNKGVEGTMRDILFDPQTSGGLLLAIHPRDIDKAIDNLEQINKNPFAIIGQVIEKKEANIYVNI